MQAMGTKMPRAVQVRHWKVGGLVSAGMGRRREGVYFLVDGVVVE